MIDAFLAAERNEFISYMHEIFDIGARIATPLALAGFLGAVLFLFLRQVIQAKLIPAVRHSEAAPVLLHIVNWLCVLCLVAMILGFTGYVIRRWMPSSRDDPVRTASFYVSTTWMSRPIWPLMWFVDEYHPGMKRVTQVHEAALIEFTNLKPVPIMIAAYAVETELPNGEWKRMEAVTPNSVTHGQVFFGEDLKRVREMKYWTFNSAIENKNIAPNETVRGWLIFQYWYTGKRRFELKDTTGLVSTEPFSSGFENDGNVAGATPWPLWPVQPLLSELSSDFQDISDLPVW